MTIKNENYINVQGWMINELHLKGNELIIYALIYGFSQTEGQVYSGGLQYLADWTNSTKQGVIKNLKSLVEKGYIVKNEKVVNNVKFCEYYSTKFNGVLNKVEQGIKQSLTEGSQQSLPNNISLDNQDNNINKKKESKKESSFDEIINNYTSDEKTKMLLGEWLKVRKVKRAAMTNYAISLNIKKLDSLATQSNMNVNQYLEEVIARGWQAFYVINNFNNNSQPNQQNQKTQSTSVNLNSDPDYINKYEDINEDELNF